MKVILQRLALALLLHHSSFAATGGPDAYGYTWDDATPYHWIDISATGQVVVNAGSNVSSNHPVLGIGSPVDLGFPFTLYGATHTRLVPCVNGYLSTLASEEGLDNSNDCPLPKFPSHGGGARIYAFHDDLVLGSGASIYYRYFHASPHPYATCGVSVFTWKNVARSAAPSLPFDFQVLLFDTGDILINYDSNGLILGATATVAIQNAAATTALSWICNTPAAISGTRAVVFIPPTITVGSRNDENDTPAGASISLREAIRDIPTGGKIKFGGNGRNLDYPATLTINRAMSLVGDFEGGWRSVRTARISLVADGAPVCITNFDIHDGPGTTLTARNSAVLKLAGCSIQGSVSHAVRSENNAHVALVRTNIEFPAPNSLDLVFVENATLHLHESALADSYRSGIAGSNSILPLPATPQISLFHSSIIRCREHGMNLSGLRTQILASTISDNQGDGIITRAAPFVLEQSALLDNSRGLVVESGGDAGITRTVLARNTNRTSQAAADLVLSGGSAVSGGHNLAGATYGVFTATGDVVAADPKFTPVGPYGPAIGCLRFPGHLYAHHPLADSPAIDGGGLAAAPAHLPLDPRGLARVANGDNSGGAVIDIGPLEAGPFITVTTAVDENNGIGAGAGASLREAAMLASATPGTRVLFAASLDGQTINTDIPSGGLGATIGIHAYGFVDASKLPKGLTISYNGNGGGPIIAGGAWHGITLTGARAQAVNNFVTLTLSSCVFFDNQSPDDASFGVRVNGGAIFNADYLHLTDCRFVSNQTSGIVGGRGGAVATQTTIPLGEAQTRGASHFIRCHFENNTGHGGGGAIYQHPSARRALIDRCSFKGNFTEGVGGAVEMFETNIEGTGGSSDSKRARNLIFRSAFHENQSLDDTFVRGGGAIAVFGGAGAVLPVHFCTFHDNYSRGEGGAIYVSSTSIVVDVGGSPVLFPGCTLDVFRSTVTNNHSDGGAGGGGIAILDGTVRMTGSILDLNTYFSNLTNTITPGSFLAQGTGVFQSLGRNLSGDSPLPAFNHATDLVGVDPRLGPLANHGGPTPARHPLAGSPAIDSGTATSRGTDQRGYAGRAGTNYDIGAVEAFTPLVVNTSNDEFNTPSGPTLSLREAIRDCLPGGWITFNTASLSMPTHFINLAAGQNTQLSIAKTLMIDATNTPKGITISGPTANRCLDLTTGSHHVSLHGVSFRQGNVTGSPGGGIRKGAGVSLVLTRSAIYQNSTSQNGGGLALLSGPAYLENVTLSGNAAGGTGGGLIIQAGASARLHHCTLAYNQSASGGAGIDAVATASLHLQYTGVVENTRTSPVILANIVAAPGATTTAARANFADDGPYPWLPFAGPGFADIGGLSDMGGTALGHPLLEASPMLDASSTWTTTRTDARGFGRVFGGLMDIGAIEVGSTSTNLPPIDSDNDGMPDDWEILHGLNPNSPLDAHLDSDGDGQSNLQEYYAQTNPRDRNSVFRILSVIRNTNAGRIDIDWTCVPHLTYTVYRSTNLGTWTPVGTVIPEAGAFQQTTTITNAPIVAEPHQFFQVRVGNPPAP